MRYQGEISGLKHTIRIEGDGTWENTRVLLDGHDISNFVTNVTVEIDGGIPRVNLDLIGRLELPDELQAIVEVGVPEQELTPAQTRAVESTIASFLERAAAA